MLSLATMHGRQLATHSLVKQLPRPQAPIYQNCGQVLAARLQSMHNAVNDSDASQQHLKGNVAETTSTMIAKLMRLIKPSETDLPICSRTAWTCPALGDLVSARCLHTDLPISKEPHASGKQEFDEVPALRLDQLDLTGRSVTRSSSSSRLT